MRAGRGVSPRTPGGEATIDDEQELVTLLEERQVLIVFFPLAFTGTCQGELGFIRDHYHRFVNDEVAAVAVSVGPPPTHKVWSGTQGYLFPILSDFWPHGAVSRDYGVLNAKHGYPNRGTFVIDREGVVRVLQSHSRVIVIEETSPQNGLGPMVKQIAWDMRAVTDLQTFSLRGEFVHVYGSHDDLLAVHGLATPHILETIAAGGGRENGSS